MAYVMRKTPRSSFMRGMGATPAPPDESPPVVYAPPGAKPLTPMPPTIAPPMATTPRFPPILLWGGGALLAYWFLFKE
jgi:hypothetical protein